MQTITIARLNELLNIDVNKSNILRRSYPHFPKQNEDKTYNLIEVIEFLNTHDIDECVSEGYAIKNDKYKYSHRSVSPLFDLRIAFLTGRTWALKEKV